MDYFLLLFLKGARVTNILAHTLLVLHRDDGGDGTTSQGFPLGSSDDEDSIRAQVGCDILSFAARR